MPCCSSYVGGEVPIQIVINDFMGLWSALRHSFDMNEWCRENCQGAWKAEWIDSLGPIRYVFEFEEGADAVLFKLRWL